MAPLDYRDARLAGVINSSDNKKQSFFRVDGLFLPQGGKAAIFGF
jgi:hypothetical protein